MHSRTLAIPSQTTQAAVLQLHSTSAPPLPSFSVNIDFIANCCVYYAITIISMLLLTYSMYFILKYLQ